MISSLKRPERGCARTTASRSASVNSENAMPSTSISTPAVTSATTGCMCCGMPGVVCSAIAVQTVVDVALGDAVAAQEVAGGIGAVDLEALIGAGVLLGQAHVVEHGAGIEQLGIEAQTAPLAGERAPVIDAARMVEQQRRLGIPDQFGHFARQFAVGNDDPRYWMTRRVDC